MRGTLMYGPRDVRVQDVPEPSIVGPTDAIVRIVRACVCGSDLWPYRGVDDPSWPMAMATSTSASSRRSAPASCG